ncbi:class I SAM-dependent methyltransferase [Kitasatospora sp. CM 4170]|uniref:class I SAM-dependent methyltransferase n=1 Tax=Kitasatospora TaxID=2063 RepID=UPI0028AAE96D|nr:class I SAM-dependent methyltransferase [Kitasatospora sp. CM 4170]WNM43273.1 class I SAM-dependent methyltransferase [Kitasatospora sp. CM 4170]
MTAAHPPLAAQVPATAFLTALARAEATADPRSGLRDPYAEHFAAHCPAAIRRVTRHTAGTSSLVTRTVAVDGLLTGLFAERAADPVGPPWEVCVNLGAGFDARPYRLAWPAHCRVIEIDCAPVLDLKDRLLPTAAAPVPVERLRCDLRDLTALAGLLRPRTAGRRVLLLAEGLLTYLPEAQVRALAAELAGIGDAWICDVLSVASAGGLTAAARTAGTPLTMHGLADLTPFEATGWRCDHLDLLPTAQLSPRPGATTGLLPDSVLRLRRHS